MKTGIELIIEERHRQIQEEGWTPEHDDRHGIGEMAVCGACYALDVYAQHTRPIFGRGIGAFIGDLWPWAAKWWKPTPDDPIRQLTKAGALIAAEIDRLQRMRG